MSQSNPSDDTDTKPEKWACSLCTFLNLQSTIVCEMCGTRNPSAPESNTMAGSSDQFWSCSACTMRNPRGASACPMCGTPNPDPKGTWDCLDCGVTNFTADCHSCGASANDAEDTQALTYGGVRVSELESLVASPSPALLDKLNSMAHGLAMMLASTGDGEDLQAAFFLQRSKPKVDDEKFVDVLFKIIGDEAFPLKESVLTAFQCVNYIIKLDNRLIRVSCDKGIVGLYFEAIRNVADGNKKANLDSQKAEEALTGLKTIATMHGEGWREIMEEKNVRILLRFLDKSMAERPQVILSALSILQEICSSFTVLKTPTATLKSRKKKRGSRGSTLKTNTFGKEQMTLITSILSKFLNHSASDIREAVVKCFSRLVKRTIVLNLPLESLVGDSVMMKLVELLQTTTSTASSVQAAVVDLLAKMLKFSPELVSKSIECGVCSALISALSQSAATSTNDYVPFNYLKLLGILLKLLCLPPKSGKQGVPVGNRMRLDSKSKAASSCSSPSLSNVVSDDKVEIIDKRVSKKAKQGTVKRKIADGRYTVQLPSGDEVSLLKNQLRRSSKPDEAVEKFKRPRLDSLPDPDVISTHLLNFVRAGETGMVRKIIYEGADVTTVNSRMEAPLVVAAIHAPVDLVRMLIRRGAPLDACGITGPALHAAVRLKRKEIIKVLLEAGANVSAKDRSGLTALDIATGPISKMLKNYQHQNIVHSEEEMDAEDDDIDIEHSYDSHGEDSEFYDSEDFYESNLSDCDEVDQVEGVDEATMDTLIAHTAAPSSSETPKAGFVASMKQKLHFTDRLLVALLDSYRAAKSKHLRKSVLAVMVFLLEVAPSQLVHKLDESELSRLLSIVQAQLLDVELHLSCKSTVHFNGLRMLQAICRKSRRDSSFFSKVVRHGIYELVEQVEKEAWSDGNESIGPADEAFSVSLAGTTSQKTLSSMATLFLSQFKLMYDLRAVGGCFDQLKIIAASLHGSDRDAIITALRSFFTIINSPEGITAFEFKKTNLADALLAFLNGQSGSRDRNLQLFEDTLEGAKENTAAKIIQLLQEVIATSERLGIRCFKSQRHRPFHALARGIRLELIKKDAAKSPKPKPAEVSRAIMVQPLVRYELLQNAVLRTESLNDPSYMAYCCSLVGHRIVLTRDSSPKQYLVEGYDQDRGYHLLSPHERARKTFIEMDEVLLHVENYKLFDQVSVKAPSKRLLDVQNYGLSDEERERSKTKPKSKQGIKRSITATTPSGSERSRKRSRLNSKKASPVAIKQNSAKVEPLVVGSLVEVQSPATSSSGTTAPWFVGRIETEDSPKDACTYKILFADGRSESKVSAERVRAVNATPVVGSVVKIVEKMDGIDKGEKAIVTNLRRRTYEARTMNKNRPCELASSAFEYPIDLPARATSSSSTSSSTNRFSVGERVWIRPNKRVDGVSFAIAGYISSWTKSTLSDKLLYEIRFSRGRASIVSEENVVKLSKMDQSELSSGQDSADGISPAVNRHLSDVARDSIRNAFSKQFSGESDLQRLRRAMESVAEHSAEGDEEGILGVQDLLQKVISGRTSDTSPPEASRREEKLVAIKPFVCRTPPSIHLELQRRDGRGVNGSCLVASDLVDRHTDTLTPAARVAFSSIFKQYAVRKLTRRVSQRRKRAARTPKSSAGRTEGNMEPKMTKDRFLQFLRQYFSHRASLHMHNWFTRYSDTIDGLQVLTEEGFLHCMSKLSGQSRLLSDIIRCLRSQNFNDSHFIKDQEKRQPDTPAETMRFDGEDNLFSCIQRLIDYPALESNSRVLKSFYTFAYDIAVQFDGDEDASETSRATNADRVDPSCQYRELAEIVSPWKHLHPSPVIPVQSDVFWSTLNLINFLHRWLLSTARYSTLLNERDAHIWTNLKINQKLDAQLEDVLAIASSTSAKWCEVLPVQCKYLFSFETRTKLFKSSAFGWYRSLHWLHQQEMKRANTSADGESGVYLSPLRREKVEIRREELLSSCQDLMSKIDKKKAILEIVFAGERGYGSGVTASFYSAVAEELQSIKENSKLPCWISGDESAEDEVIRHPAGLFPRPLHPTDDKAAAIIERFELMGQIAGKALIDERIFPFPLSPQFMAAVLGQPIAIEELPDLFLQPGRIILDLCNAMQHSTDSLSFKIGNCDAEDWFEAADLVFTDPLSQKPLIKKGEMKQLNKTTLQEYVPLVLELWLNTGIKKQIQAFRQGLDSVVSIPKLHAFTPDEVLELIRGSEDLEWDLETLQGAIKPAHGYTAASAPFRNFLEVLSEFSSAERREFLLFATGCPSLPPGGLENLHPPFEVSRRATNTAKVDDACPFARTCTNTMHLPPYTSKKALEKQLRYAMISSKGVIDRD